MIIDIHTHFWGKGYIPRAFHMATAQDWAAREPGRDPLMILPKIEEGLVDPDGSLFIRNMDQAGVDTSFIMGADFGVYWGGEEPEVPLEEQLRAFAELQEKFPGRLYAFVMIDPRRANAVDLFSRAIREWGLKGCGEFGLKNLSVADDEAQPLIRKCADLDVPVLIHTRATGGTDSGALSWGDLTSKNINHPDQVEKILERYPGLKVILSHVGYPFWWEKAAHIAGKYPNCYLDIANWDRDMKEPESLIPKLACMRDMVGADHICFGSDQSSGKRHSGEQSVMARWLGFLRELPEKARAYGYVFSQDEMDLILGGSARKLFNL